MDSKAPMWMLFVGDLVHYEESKMTILYLQRHVDSLFIQAHQGVDVNASAFVLALGANTQCVLHIIAYVVQVLQNSCWEYSTLYNALFQVHKQ